MEISIPNRGREVVTESQGQIEAIKPRGREHREVTAPVVSIVKPALIFNVAREKAHVAADWVGWRLQNRPRQYQGIQCPVGIRNPIGKLQNGVDQSARI